MGIFSRRSGLPGDVDAALSRARGERVLAFGVDEHTSGHVVATDRRLVVVGATGRVALDRPWHDVAAGTWEPLTRTISVTWVDGGRVTQWTFPSAGERFAEVFHDRVANSRVLDAPVELGGATHARVAIRRDLATGELLRQTSWARGRPSGDPAVLDYARVVLDDLAEQVGLPTGPNTTPERDD